MLDLFREISRRRAAGDTVALATVVDVKGSTPRLPGARMIVKSDGSILGTVGGGCGENEVWLAALEVLRTGVSQMVHVDLTADATAREDAVCGGTMEVFVEALGPIPPFNA